MSYDSKCQAPGCGLGFNQKPGRTGRPRKYCSPECANSVARVQRAKSDRRTNRFPSKEAFWEWQRSPERRAELRLAELRRHRAATSAVVKQAEKVLEAARGLE